MIAPAVMPAADAAAAERIASPPGTYVYCVTCNGRKHRQNEMYDAHECRECRGVYLDRTNRRRVNQDLANKAKALGQAVNSMVTEIGKGDFVPNQPHLVYAAVLDNFGGIPGFARLVKERFDCACSDEKPSHKVILDYFKMIITLGVEALKTQPPPPNCNDMNDQELGEYIARLMGEKLSEMERAQAILEGTVIPEPIPEDRETMIDLLVKAQTEAGAQP